MKRIAALLLIMAALAGCAGHAPSNDDSAYRARQSCQNTAIGQDARRVCY